MKDTELKIILDKEYFEADEFITGKVSLKSRVPLHTKKLRLNFTKNRVMEVCKIESPGAKGMKYSSNKKEYSYDFDLFKESELSSGAHQFPFKFCLKSMDSSTSEIRGIYFDYLVNIINTYTLTSSIFIDGSSASVYQTKKDVQIAEIIDRTEHFQTKLEVSTLMCLFYKTYTLKFQLNRPIYYSGDQIKLEINMNRSISKIIKSIECNLYEVMTIKSPDIDIIRTRYVVGGNAVSEKKHATLCLRIPPETPTCVNKDTFGLKILMFINILFVNSGPIRIRKYVQVIKRKNELPDLETIDVLDGEKFEEKVFVLT